MSAENVMQTLDGQEPVGEPQEETVHHESQRKKAKKSGLQPAKMGVNLTSMIDVVFQLLIYFVLTLTFTADEGVLSAHVPEGPGTPKPDTSPPENVLKIRVQSVGSDGLSYRLSIEGHEQPVDFIQLAKALEGLQFDPSRGFNGQYKPDNKVVIKPDPNVRWEHVVNAFNAAVKARYSNIRFGAPEAVAESGE